MEWDMEKVHWLIRTDLSTMVNGKEEWNGEMEKWLILAETIMKDNGLIIRETA
jgi:hypothetical protein